jgi:hypothetical protein
LKKASEYRLHAQECRELAVQMDSDQQRQLMLHMAEHWEKLATDRLALLERHPELADNSAEFPRPVEPRTSDCP